MWYLVAAPGLPEAAVGSPKHTPKDQNSAPPRIRETHQQNGGLFSIKQKRRLVEPVRGLRDLKMAIVVGICLLGALCGLGYVSLGSEAATAHALEEGLLQQKRDPPEDVQRATSPSSRSDSELRMRDNAIAATNNL